MTINNSITAAASYNPQPDTASLGAQNASDEGAVVVANPQSKSRVCQIPYAAWANRILSRLDTKDVLSLRKTCRMFGGNASFLKNGAPNWYQQLLRENFASRLCITSPSGLVPLSTSFDPGACFSLEKLVEEISLAVSDLCNRVMQLPDEVVKKLIIAIAQNSSIVANEINQTGKFNGFIQSLGLTQKEQAQCQKISENLFGIGSYLGTKVVPSIAIFGSRESKQYLKDQEKQLEELQVQAKGLNSEDILKHLNNIRSIESEALRLSLAENVFNSVMKIFQQISPWIEKHMGKELLVKTFKSCEFSDLSQMFILDDRVSYEAPEESCAKFFRKNPEIRPFLGLLFLSGLYTREQIQGFVSHSLKIRSAWTQNPEELISITELAKQPNRAEILLNHPVVLEAKIITAILECNPLPQEVVFTLIERLIRPVEKATSLLMAVSALSAAIAAHSAALAQLKAPLNQPCEQLLRISNEDRIRFLMPLLKQHQETLPIDLLGAIFLESTDPSGQLFSNEDRISFVTPLLNQHREALSSHLIKTIDSRQLLSNEDRIRFLTPFLKQSQETLEALPIDLLRTLFWKSTDPSALDLARGTLSHRDPGLRHVVREIAGNGSPLSRQCRVITAVATAVLAMVCVISGIALLMQKAGNQDL